MSNLNFDSYFDDTEHQYYDSKYIITILEDILGGKLDDIRNMVNNTYVVVTEEQIIEFLGKTFEQEDSELKRRIENPKPKRSGNCGKLTEEEIENLSQEFDDKLRAERYCFDPYTLEYFNRYSNIVRNKILVLLSIIEKIGNRDFMSIQDLLSELDIQLDKNGNISKEDIIRLITPTVYNIDALNQQITKANDLATYLTFKMSIHTLYKRGWSEEEIYPCSSLQIKNLNYDYIKGNVPLSSNQVIELEQAQRRSMKKSAKIIIDMFD